MPGSLFKKLIMSAAELNGYNRWFMAKIFGVAEEIVPFEGEIYERCDVITPKRGGAANCYRSAFRAPWRATFTLSWDPRLIDIASLVNLLNYGGWRIGGGAWRRERCGTFGKFHVEGAPPVEEVEVS